MFPIQWVPGKYFPEENGWGMEFDHSPLSSIKAKNKQNYASPPCICLHGVHTDNFFFTWFTFYKKHCSEY